MSMKGRDFGYKAKRHGTLKKRRENDRMRIRAAIDDETMKAFRRSLR